MNKTKIEHSYHDLFTIIDCGKDYRWPFIHNKSILLKMSDKKSDTRGCRLAKTGKTK